MKNVFGSKTKISVGAKKLAEHIAHNHTRNLITKNELKNLSIGKYIDELGSEGYIIINNCGEAILLDYPEKQYKNRWFKDRKTII